MRQMNQILDAFREGGVELLAKNSPLPAGLLGEAMAMVITIAKAFQVERAEGASQHAIREELHRRIIPSPTRLEWWPEPTIWGICR